MLELQNIRQHKEHYVDALQKRGIDAQEQLDAIVSLDASRRGIQTQLDECLAKSNQLAKEIGMLFKSGKAEEANTLKAETATLKESSKQLQEQLNEKQAALQELLYQIPNVPHKDVPKGQDDCDNEVVFEEGQPATLDDKAEPHWELAKKYELIDFELGVKISGAGFPVYTGKGARLQRALISYFLDKNTAAGYRETQVPHLVNEASGYGTGQLPDKEGQMYHVGNDDLYLIPTAEVPITNLLR
ncbi:MAG: serine--tRNA ligase, partial [Flavobacteriaceae bacterium]